MATTKIQTSGAATNHHRHLRSLTDQLEADLWIWRTECREAGKKIPKRLVQARAKWAFQREGISDFKVIEFHHEMPQCSLCYVRRRHCGSSYKRKLESTQISTFHEEAECKTFEKRGETFSNQNTWIYLVKCTDRSAGAYLNILLLRFSCFKKKKAHLMLAEKGQITGKLRVKHLGLNIPSTSLRKTTCTS